MTSNLVTWHRDNDFLWITCWLLYMFLAFSVIAIYCWDSEHYFSKWRLLFLTAARQADLPPATSFPNVPSLYQSGSWASERLFKIFKVSTLLVLQLCDVTMMSLPGHMPASITLKYSLKTSPSGTNASKSGFKFNIIN